MKAQGPSIHYLQTHDTRKYSIILLHHNRTTFYMTRSTTYF